MLFDSSKDLVSAEILGFSNFRVLLKSNNIWGSKGTETIKKGPFPGC